MKAITALLLALIVTPVHAGAADCLSQIMHAESRGESFEGLVANGQAAVTRARNQGRTVCNVTGVKRSTPPVSMMEYYLAIARQLLANPKETLTRGADSWEARLPRNKGKITARIGKHYFYRMK